MEIFCIVYYITSYIAGIPAIVKIIRTKSSNDYSLVEAALTMIGTISWTVYIFQTKQSLAVYIGTIMDLLVALVWNVSIFVYYDYGKHKQPNSVKDLKNEEKGEMKNV